MMATRNAILASHIFRHYSCLKISKTYGSTLWGGLPSFVRQCRGYISLPPHAMEAWSISQYGGIEQLNASSVTAPFINHPQEVLVKISAASINPIDARMLAGYGASSINCLRKARGTLVQGSEFPLILGRDFSGSVVATGKGIPMSRFKPGDEVWGALEATRQGTHAQYAVANVQEISKKPKSVSHNEAASLPYAALTTWSALCTFGGLTEKNALRKRILVLGGSGGTGTIAIQLLKAWGCEVVTTCRSDAAEMCVRLGADIVVDYNAADFWQELSQTGAFDMILDTVGRRDPAELMVLLKSGYEATYVTIVSPLLDNTDQLGVPFGIAQSAVAFGAQLVKGLQHGRNVRWAYFFPSWAALQKLAILVDEKKILPVIDKIIPFEDLPSAYEQVKQRHNRGKTVIDFTPT